MNTKRINSLSPIRERFDMCMVNHEDLGSEELYDEIARMISSKKWDSQKVELYMQRLKNSSPEEMEVLFEELKSIGREEEN